MTRAFSLIVFLVTVLSGAVAAAQDRWLQIEARPSLAEAQERAQAYAGVFDNVNGFKLSSGWYGIALGPFTPEEAQRKLDLLIGEKMIPSDSFIAPDGTLGQHFWPVGAAATATGANTAVDPATAQVTTPTTAPDTEETPEQARSAELALLPQDRQDLQSAMQYFGVYQGKIDGSFGPGTRTAMAAWQDQNGAQPTGILTTAQRKALVDGWRAERNAFGLSLVTEAEAGIDLELPMGLVEFDRYDPPFVAYKPKNGSAYQVVLISRRGDAKTLTTLYNQTQSLALMPLEGERGLKPASFTINGVGTASHAYAEATLTGGMVKGFVLVWPASDDRRAARILDIMKATFLSNPTEALDEDLGETSTIPEAELTSGLEARRPVLSRSGVFINATGSVLTTTEVLRQCTRLTLDGIHNAKVSFQDDALGIAVLTPQETLSPRAVAEFQPVLPRPQAEIAIAGYSYEDKLSAPVVSFGTFAEAKGLNGETTFSRLTIQTLPGDAGGAVLNSAGAMTGLLLPPLADAARQMPSGVNFALNAEAIATALTAHDVALLPSVATQTLAHEDLAARARAMTVLVSCWQ